MSDRIRSYTLFTALLFAAACGGGSDTTTGTGTAGAPSAVTPVTAAPAPAIATAPVAMCGNNKAEGAEPCDGMDLKSQTCASINPGSTGILKCNSCKLDTLMCLSAAAMPMGGAGAAQGGSGARTMGSAGAGGSGRM